MARVKKIDNAILKRLKRANERNARKTETKEERKYYLLFCEGARTEPNYFISLSKQLPKNLVKLDVDPSGGKNTISLVDHAIKMLPVYKRKNPTINYEIWIVFDRDSFPAANFDNAIAKAESNGFSCASTNEAFELWYLLHFEDYQSAISRKDYSRLLSKNLGRKYQKNDPEIYELLQNLENSNEALAVARAENLLSMHLGKSPSSSNPTTLVHRLVTELNQFKNDS